MRWVCAGPAGDPLPQCAISTRASPEITHDPQAATDSPLAAKRLGLEGARAGLHGMVAAVPLLPRKLHQGIKSPGLVEVVMTIRLRDE